MITKLVYDGPIELYYYSMLTSLIIAAKNWEYNPDWRVDDKLGKEFRRIFGIIDAMRYDYNQGVR